MEYTSKVSLELVPLLKENGVESIEPTYGEVIDWLKSKGCIITFTPFFTFSLNDGIAYTWNISWINWGVGCMQTITEESQWDSTKGFGGSFGKTADDAIKAAISLINSKQIEI